ncbi:hypothetical protein SYNPS1DRAFT_18108 [Syncephalis pseudoplumigaleata]|uniref:Uncharacterized protein n=1 Tax=Syncephalis pseudoplumigaleata TaxID=1712513 RepID=A0A4V1J143_9FUNG|nr:hypothetical protein SYNPS1DRAFT_18145 [Syncephalis pseudoplumigaleata]RKP23784.1 hypothetical protein SYNPS1DRAFT_18108 [Syncephalis pseudoplumigaleata]|eukprot:RKP23759.1 hypothetical protein SYNPS1DRAFT_18145 [Syncephalis pseudoplumigaleata]
MSGRKRVTYSGSGEGNALVRFVKREIWHPEKRAGNATIALSLAVFTGAVVFLRKFGDLLAV